MSTSTMARPSFDWRSPASRELHDAIKELWSSRRVRWLCYLELFSKVPVAFGLMLGSYFTLLLVTSSRPWAAFLLFPTMVLGGVVMGSLLHDTNHLAMFTPLGLSRRWDTVAAWLVTNVMLGISSHYWKNKHEQHHVEANILGLDPDIHHEPLIRLHPDSRKRMNRWAKYQHNYVWVIFPLLFLSMHINGYRTALFGGVQGNKTMARVRGWRLFWEILGLLAFWTWAIVVPVWLAGWWGLVVFVVFVLLMGLVFAPLFQFAHNVDIVDTETPENMAASEGHEDGNQHQLRTTAAFCINNWLLPYITGMLTHQPDHHIARSKPHTFCRYLNPVLRQWCDKWGVPYHLNRTLRDTFGSHRRHLRNMGQLGVFVELEMG